jgi:uncharacterized protein YbjT (DUF2867 family)
MTLKNGPTGRRITFEDVRYTLSERVRFWFSRLFDPVPKTWSRQIAIGPDDPRFKDAIFAEVMVAGPRFVYNSDGKLEIEPRKES